MVRAKSCVATFGTRDGGAFEISNQRTDVKPIPYLKNRTADLVRQVSEEGQSVTITQNGEAKVVNELPRGAPVNVILFPIEGDPLAAAVFWAARAGFRGRVAEPVEGLAMRKTRGHREIEVFGLSFLDVISSRFAAGPLESQDAPRERPPHGASGPAAIPHLCNPDPLKPNELRFEFRLAVLEKHLYYFTTLPRDHLTRS